MPSQIHFGRSLVAGLAMMLAAIPALVSGAARKPSLDARDQRPRRRQPHPLPPGRVDGFGHVSVRHPGEPGPLPDVVVARAGARHQGRHHGVRPGLRGRSTSAGARSTPSASSIPRSTRRVRTCMRSCTATRRPSFRSAPSTCRCVRSSTPPASSRPRCRCSRCAAPPPDPAASWSPTPSSARRSPRRSATGPSPSCAATAMSWSGPTSGAWCRARSTRRSTPACSCRRSRSASQIIYLDETEARAGEDNRDKSERGHSTDRTWQMWVEEAMGPGSCGSLGRATKKRRPDRHFPPKIEAKRPSAWHRMAFGLCPRSGQLVWRRRLAAYTVQVQVWRADVPDSQPACRPGAVTVAVHFRRDDRRRRVGPPALWRTVALAAGGPARGARPPAARGRADLPAHRHHLRGLWRGRRAGAPDPLRRGAAHPRRRRMGFA